MTFGDQKSDCKSEFTQRLTKELREATARPDAFDPNDMGWIFDIEYLMLVFAALNKADLIRGCPTVLEAKEWLAKFKANFEPWESYDDYPNMLKAFEDFVAVCDDNN